MELHNNILRTFYNNQSERETVHKFIIDCLKELAIDYTFDGKEVTGIKDAKKAIDNAFDRLEELYGKIEETIISNSR